MEHKPLSKEEAMKLLEIDTTSTQRSGATPEIKRQRQKREEVLASDR